MKKIIFIHLLNDYSGSPKVLSQVIQGVKSHHKVELLTGKGENGFLSNVAPAHTEFFYKWSKFKLITLLNFLISQLILFFKVIKFRRSADVIYINTMLPFGAALAGKLSGVPIIYHIHETSIRPRTLKLFLRFIIQKTASEIIFVSRSLYEQEGFLEIGQRIIYNSLPADFLTNAQTHKRDFRWAENFNVLMIASLKDYKGIKEFVELANLMSPEKEIEFQLVLNAEDKEIEYYFKEIPRPSNLIVHSKQTNVHSFYQLASLVLNLSRPDEWEETFGLTILEAMAYGLPVIVPPVGGPAEIVNDGMEGYLISCYDLDQISGKISELARDKTKYDQLSKNALKRAGDFNEQTFQKEILAVINE